MTAGGTQNKCARCLSSNTSKANETDDIIHDLTNKHHHKYNPEQLHAWAEMVQMKKHSSLEVPPKFPFFKGGHEEPIAQEKLAVTAVSFSSPSHTHAQTECIEQLKKIRIRCEKGLISQDQHDKLSSYKQLFSNVCCFS